MGSSRGSGVRSLCRAFGTQVTVASSLSPVKTERSILVEPRIAPALQYLAGSQARYWLLLRRGAEAEPQDPFDTSEECVTDLSRVGQAAGRHRAVSQHHE